MPLKKKTLINYIENHLIDNTGSNYANHFGAWLVKENMPKEYMGVPKLYKFENVELYGVENAERYLECLYGDWRKEPPTDEQHRHINEVYYR